MSTIEQHERHDGAMIGYLLAHLDIAADAMEEAAAAMEEASLTHEARDLRRVAARARAIVTAQQQKIRGEVDRILGSSSPTRKPQAGPVRRSPEGEDG